MKALAFLVGSAAVLASFEASAQAYNRPYCMEVSQGWGGSIRDCSYETFQQCYASKVDISSTCSRNPSWYGVPDSPPRRKKKRS